MMRPYLPIEVGESFVSWVSRFAKLQCGLSTVDFLRMFDLTQNDIRAGRDCVVEAMSELSGVPTETLRMSLPKSCGVREYECRDELFSLEFLTRQPTRYCPHCILKDLSETQFGMEFVKGRQLWLLSPVRSCSIHSVRLEVDPDNKESPLFADLSGHVPTAGKLEKLASGTTHRDVSRLQTYVEHRFDGERHFEWLDGQRIDLAVKATEMLGACIEFGAFFERAKLSEDEWDIAGNVGFEYTSRGEVGIWQGLEVIRRSPMKQVEKSGPQGVFGQLYQWLQFRKSDKPVGPIRQILRQHIVDTMHVKPGSNLLGEVVQATKMHSVATLAKQFKLHPKTVKHTLFKSGLVAKDMSPDNHLETVAASEAEPLMKKLCRAVPVVHLPKYLGCSRTHAQLLVKHGLLSPVVKDDEMEGGRHKGIDSKDLDEFLTSLRKGRKAVDKPSFGLASIAEVSQTLKTPFAEISELLIAGLLTEVEHLRHSTSMKEVFVSANEVAFALGLQTGKMGVTISETAKELKLENDAVEFLTSLQKNDGKAFLNVCGHVRHMGEMRPLIDPASLDEFKSNFRKLLQITGYRKLRARDLRAELRARGVFPIVDPDLIGAEFYRLSDL